MCGSGSDALRLFVYGTLMPGGAHHARYLEGFPAGAARVEGKLYALPAGYPALEVDAGQVLAEATGDPWRDAALQHAHPPRGDPPTAGGAVHGALVELPPDPARLAAIDALEGFRPGGGGLYERVLLTAWLESAASLTAWTYVQPRPRGRLLADGRWPGRTRAPGSPG